MSKDRIRLTADGELEAAAGITSETYRLLQTAKDTKNARLEMESVMLETMDVLEAARSEVGNFVVTLGSGDNRLLVFPNPDIDSSEDEINITYLLACKEGYFGIRFSEGNLTRHHVDLDNAKQLKVIQNPLSPEGQPPGLLSVVADFQRELGTAVRGNGVLYDQSEPKPKEKPKKFRLGRQRPEQVATTKKRELRLEHSFVSVSEIGLEAPLITFRTKHAVGYSRGSKYDKNIRFSVGRKDDFNVSYGDVVYDNSSVDLVHLKDKDGFEFVAETISGKRAILEEEQELIDTQNELGRAIQHNLGITLEDTPKKVQGED